MTIGQFAKRRVALLALALLAPVPAHADEVLVSAASSLTESMTEIGAAFTKANPRTVVRFNFASSGALEQQILQGAPVDVFASAAHKEMDALQRAGRIDATTRIDFTSNRLVLITPVGGHLRGWDDLNSPAVRRIAISNPDSVPSGMYAKETLTRRGLWSAVQPKAVFGENVRQTLAYVSGGNVDAGIVFASDARIVGGRVRVVAEAVPGRDHAPIVYPAAVVRDAPNPPGARAFVAFLRSPSAQAILARHGFTPLAAPAVAPRSGRAPAKGKAPPSSGRLPAAVKTGPTITRRQRPRPAVETAPTKTRTPASGHPPPATDAPVARFFVRTSARLRAIVLCQPRIHFGGRQRHSNSPAASGAEAAWKR
jgi:molybdate transport system substrate-binding protein